MSIDEDLNIKTKEYPKQDISIRLPFELYQSEQKQKALDYIFDLTSFKFTDVNELLSKKALNNLLLY